MEEGSYLMIDAPPSTKANVLLIPAVTGRGGGGGGSRPPADERARHRPFVRPRALVRAGGGRKPFEWVADNLDSDSVDATFILLVTGEEREDHDVIKQLRRPPNVKMKFVVVDDGVAAAGGALRAALLAREHVDNDDPLLIVDSDAFVEWDADAYWKDRRRSADEGGIDGDVLCLRAPTDDGDDERSRVVVGEDGHVANLRAKSRHVASIEGEGTNQSEYAAAGAYYWARGADFVESAEAAIASGDGVEGDRDVASACAHGIQERGRKFAVSFCENVYRTGSPGGLARFLGDYARPKLRDAAAEESDEGGGEAPSEGFLGRTSGPAVFVAHRGNVDGPNPKEENRPEYLLRALSMGFDVEVDAWLDPASGRWSLGHDSPEYPVDYDFLLTPGFWVHAKNAAALRAMVRDPRVHCFSHDGDDYALTSRGFVWAYPEMELAGSKCVAVMYSRPELLLDQEIGGICHDVVGPLRDRYIAMRRLDGSVCSTQRTIRLVVLDLDALLVEGPIGHCESSGQAPEGEAGGVPTSQKSRMLEEDEGPSNDPSKNECTENIVGEAPLPSDDISKAVAAVKRMCLPVCATSNGSRSSAKTVLDRFGLMPFVDVILSDDDVGRPKPAPDIYQKACAIFGVDPGDALVVGASKEGYEAASRAGCHLLRISNPGGVTESCVRSRVRELETLTEEATVIIPLVGPRLDIRQAVDETEMPAYLADRAGRRVLEIIGKSLRSRRRNLNYVFVVGESAADAFDVDALCAEAVDYAPLKIVEVGAEIQSAARAMRYVPTGCIPDDAPLLVVDGLHLPVWKDGGSLDDLLGSHSDAAVTVFRSIDSGFPYVRLNRDARGDADRARRRGPDAVVEVTTGSVPPSNLACSGLYYFRRARYFARAAEAVVAADGRRPAGRFDTARTINEVIEEGHEVEALRLDGSWPLRNMDEIETYERLASRD